MSVPPRPVRKHKLLKRPNGLGTIYQVKGKELWAVQFYETHPVSGERKRKTKKFRSSKHAHEFLEELNHNLRKGISTRVSNEKLTVREFLDEYLTRYASKKAPETYRNYKGAAKRISDVIGGLNASGLKPRDVEDLITSLELNFGPSTVSNAYAVLRTAYNKAVKLGDFQSNPTLKVDAPTKDLKPSGHIPREDFHKIYDAAALNPYSHARVEIGLFVPIRPGETLGLRWDDVNWDLGTLRIERQLQRVTGQGLVFRATKNKKTRTIPITAGTLEVLRNHLAYQEMNKEKWVADGNLIFPNTIGRPLDAKRDLKWWKDILNRAGVQHYQVYQMRKTAISHLENLGTPLSTLLKFTGHSSITTVYNHYATSTSQADIQALQGLENLRKDRSA